MQRTAVDLRNKRVGFKRPWLIVFLLAFFTSLSFILPYIVLDKGLFLFFGDFCVQQVPFYQLAHDAIRSGNIWWNWNTDLGANFIGSYAFYLLGSPFFWLTIPLPSAAVPYTIGPLLAFKISIAAVTAYFYIARFVKKKDYAIIGALLYAFSSYSVYDIFFNHFHEPMAFFPLLLIGLEELMQNNRKGLFAITVFINAIVNYNFFVGEVMFVIIYWIVRLASGSWNISVKKFLVLAFEAIIGFAMSSALIVPAVLAITDNPRTSDFLSGWNLLVYNWPQRYLDIIHSVFFPQDLPSSPVFFPESNAKWSSIAAWLPMFSMTGVIPLIIEKRGHWLRRLLIILFAFALVPGLNSIFVLFNDAYYARWFYMGVLMLALATAIVYEDPKTNVKRGLIYTVVISAIFTAFVGLVPQIEKGKFIQLGLESDIPRFWAYVLLVAFGLLILFAVVTNFRRGSRRFARAAIIGLVVTSSVYGNLFIATGKGLGWNGEWFKTVAVEGSEYLQYDESQFSRIDVLNAIDNQGMFWKIPTINAFHSVVPASIMEYYTAIGVTRDVASRPSTGFPGVRCLTSVKYVFDASNSAKIDMPGYERVGQQLNFTQWENKNYIPMGFTYTKYLSQSEFDNAANKDQVLLKAILLNDNQIEKYKSFLEPFSTDEEHSYTADHLAIDCAARREHTCSEFSYDNKGFSAKITLPSENLVFFSVPYDKGWTATVNGKPVTVEKVNVGFMAVDCKAGTSEIRFEYTTPGLYTGIAVTGGSVGVFIIYLLICRALEKKRATKKLLNSSLIDEEELPDELPKNEDSQASETVNEDATIDAEIKDDEDSEGK